MQRQEFLKLTRDYMRDRNRKIVSYKNLSQILDCMIDAFLVGLKNDHQVRINGFGNFQVRDSYQRNHYNQITKEKHMHTVPRGFKVRFCKRFYDEINKDD